METLLEQDLTKNVCQARQESKRSIRMEWKSRDIFPGISNPLVGNPQRSKSKSRESKNMSPKQGAIRDYSPAENSSGCQGRNKTGRSGKSSVQKRKSDWKTMLEGLVWMPMTWSWGLNAGGDCRWWAPGMVKCWMRAGGECWRNCGKVLRNRGSYITIRSCWLWPTLFSCRAAEILPLVVHNSLSQYIGWV